jgi:hypothetical protein
MIKNRTDKTVTVDGKEVEIYIQKPTNEAIKLADRYKSKIWNQSIQDDVLTKKELKVLMNKRGIWDEASDEEEDKITMKIVELERKLYCGDGKNKPKVSDGKEYAIEIRRQRFNLRDLIADRISLEENTAESLADNARFDFLVSACTFYKDGTPVWESFDVYNSQSSDEIAYSAATTLGQILYNLDTSFEKNLPENVFLAKFGLVNDDLSLVDPEDGETLIDTTGQKIDDEGYLLDDDGERVDKEGNKITDAGLYELTDYVNDLAPKPKPKPKRATKRKKVTEEAEEAMETEIETVTTDSQ